MAQATAVLRTSSDSTEGVGGAGGAQCGDVTVGSVWSKVEEKAAERVSVLRTGSWDW